MRFADQVVIVTGATSGIGRATALAFAREGAKVVAAGRRQPQGDTLVKEILHAGGQAIFVQTDVTVEEQVRNLVEVTLSTFGKLDIAFNNAGLEGEHFIPVHKQTIENYQTVMNGNVLSVLLSMKYEIPAMLKTGSGAIVNTASVAGLVGMGSMSVYAAAKHAVMGLTKSAALEYARQGIRINAISPGVVVTEIFDRFAASGSSKELMETLHPIGRVGKVEEITGGVLWLCSQEASFTTGTNLTMDGGWTAQ